MVMKSRRNPVIQLNRCPYEASNSRKDCDYEHHSEATGSKPVKKKDY